MIFSFLGDDEGIEATTGSFVDSTRICSTSIGDSFVSFSVVDGEVFDLEAMSVEEDDVEICSSLTAVVFSPCLAVAGVGNPFFCLNIEPSLTNFSFHASRISSAKKMPSCFPKKQEKNGQSHVLYICWARPREIVRTTHQRVYTSIFIE